MPKSLVKNQKETTKYNAGGATSNVHDKSKACKFVAVVSNLKIHYYVSETTPLGTVTEPRAIQFKYQYFETDNAEHIEALRNDATYGGSAANEYKDCSTRGEHFFYEGAYPEWVRDKLSKEKGMLRDTEGAYEPDKPVEERFTSSEIL